MIKQRLVSHFDAYFFQRAVKHHNQNEDNEQALDGNTKHLENFLRIFNLSQEKVQIYIVICTTTPCTVAHCITA